RRKREQRKQQKTKSPPPEKRRPKNRQLKKRHPEKRHSKNRRPKRRKPNPHQNRKPSRHPPPSLRRSASPPGPGQCGRAPPFWRRWANWGRCAPPRGRQASPPSRPIGSGKNAPTSPESGT